MARGAGLLVRYGVKAALARLKAIRAYRAWQGYNDARGGLLAGGIAYFAFFSVFPALTLGFAIFGFVLRCHPHLFHQVVSSVSDTLPGIVKDSTHPDGIIDASKPPTPNVLTITGLVSLVVLVLAGLGWLSALREGVRAMFGQSTFRANPILGRFRDIGVLALLGFSVLVSAVLSGLSNAATQKVLDWVGMSPDGLVGRIGLPLVTFAVLLVVDFGIMLLIFKVLSGISAPWRIMRSGAIVGAIGIGILKVAVAYGVVGVTNNPVLASFAVIVGLLLVMNLLSRVVLLASAWASADVDAVRAGQTSEVSEVAAELPRPRGPHELEPSFGPRSADRTAIAAGAVLGALGAVGVGALRRAGHALVAVLRRERETEKAG
jgi:membrane protein